MNASTLGGSIALGITTAIIYLTPIIRARWLNSAAPAALEPGTSLTFHQPRKLLYFCVFFLILVGAIVSSIGFIFQNSNIAAIIICICLGVPFILFGLTGCVAITLWPASVYIDNEVVELRGRKTQRVKCSDITNVYASPLNGNIIIDTDIKQALMIPPAFVNNRLLFSTLRSIYFERLKNEGSAKHSPAAF